MDTDLDFSDDKIKTFLLTKLEEIRLKNENLKAVLEQYQHAGDMVKNHAQIVPESECWKRIFNNKYIIGFELFIPSKKNYKDIKAFLKWDSEEPFCYKVETFSGVSANNENCKAAEDCNQVVDNVKRNSGTFRGKPYLIIVFDVPQYIHKLGYEISGFVTYNIEGVNFTISLPKINISAKDYTTSAYVVNRDSLQQVFSVLTCLNHSDLVMILPEEWTASVTSTFEIHCAFTHLKVSILCKSYFVAHNISKLLDNTFIIVHQHHENPKLLFLKVCAVNSNQVYALCHHLGLCLTNVILFPLQYYKTYLCKQSSFSNELLEEFKKNMYKELELNYKFVQNPVSDNNIHQFRSNLSTLESHTDNLYLTISNMKY